MERDDLGGDAQSLTFEEFWSWVQMHPNCIFRIATPDVAVFDDDDLHWHFGVESEDSYLVQVIRGKKFVAEMVMRPSEVALVRCSAGEQEEHYIDLFDEADRLIVQIVMSHGYEEAVPSGPGRLTH